MMKALQKMAKAATNRSPAMAPRALAIRRGDDQARAASLEPERSADNQPQVAAFERLVAVGTYLDARMMKGGGSGQMDTLCHK